MMRCVVAALLACNALLGVPRAARAQSSGILWRPDDRVLISDFSTVHGLARDDRTLFALTPNGILRFDLSTRAFGLPITAEDGFPANERPLSIIYMPTAFSLMLGTSAGGVFSLATSSTRFEDIARVQGSVVRMVAPETSSDVFAQTAAGWFRIRGGAFFAERVAAPPPVRAPGQDDPYLRSMTGIAGSTPGRGSAQVAAIEADRRPGRYFAGTLGNGLMELDTRTLERTRHVFGITTRGAGAIAFWRGRLWFGGDDRAVAGSVTSALPDLSSFQEQLPATAGPVDAVNALLATDSALWVGTDRGLYALRGRAGSERWQLLRPPARRITALAVAGGRVFIGSATELDALDGAGTQETLIRGRFIHGLAPAHDTLWIATDIGVAALPLTASGSTAQMLVGGGSPSERVLDVRVVGDTLYAVTQSGLYRRGAAGWSPADRSLSNALGQLGGLRSDGADIWVLGQRGAAVKRAETGGWTYYVATDDIPEAPVRDLLPQGEYLWLATPAGALRIPKPR